MTVLEAALIALFYGFYASQPLILVMGPSNFGAIIGLVVGAIMGDPATGVLVGAWIQVMYLGTVHYGGTKPADQFAASIIAIPIAIATGMPVPLALVLAAIFAAISFPIDLLWKRINTNVWSPRIDRAVERLDYRAISLASGLYPMLVRIALSGGAAFVLLLVGTPAVDWFLAASPVWLVSVLSLVGVLLPALGFAFFLVALGRTQQIPFFIAGYFTMQFLHLPTLGMAAFGLFLAFLSIAWTDADFFKKKVIA